MQAMDLYFDNAATTRLSDAALKAYIDTEREFFANPSSVHKEGLKAHRELERNRECIASRLSVPSSSLFFTSGATESIAAVMSSLLLQEPGKIIISSIEHEAVDSWLRPLEAHGWKTQRLKAKGGFVSRDELAEALTPDTKMVAVMAVNNVTGAIEDIRGLVETVRNYEKENRRKIFFFSDSVQALGKISYDITGLGIDGASFSAHKINGPRGIGMLYLRRPEAFRALSAAGGQEKGKRGGTENLPAIAGFRAAVDQWHDGFEENQKRLRALNGRIRESLLGQGFRILSPQPEKASPYIISFASPLPSEVYTRMLSDRGIAVSSGSACSNNAKGEGEKILLAMGFRSAEARNAVRISMSNESDEKSVDALISAIREIGNG